MRRVLLGVGHSHLAALREAHYDRLKSGVRIENRDITFQHIDRDIFVPRDQSASRYVYPDEINSIVPDVAEVIRSLTEPQARISIFLSFLGHQYFFNSVLNNSNSFDFVLPGRPDLGFNTSVRFVEWALVKKFMSREMEPCFLHAQAYRSVEFADLFYFSSPPPIGDNDYVGKIRHIGPQIAEFGISPPDFRLKMWILQEDITRHSCEELGITYVPAPPSSVDEQGYLLRDFWNEDGFHGNSAYGELMLDHVVYFITRENIGKI